MSDSISLSPLFSLPISSVYQRDCRAMALVTSHPNNNYSDQIRQLTTQLRHRKRQHINVALLLLTLNLLSSSLPCPPTDNTLLSSNQAQCLNQLQFQWFIPLFALPQPHPLLLHMMRCNAKHPHSILKRQLQNQKFTSVLPHLLAVPHLHLFTTVGDRLAKAPSPQVITNPISLLFPLTTKQRNHLFLNHLENLEDQKAGGTT